MNSGLYAACAGLMARMQALDTIAANVANSSSAGFRGQQDVFGTVLAEANQHGRLSPLNQATNSYSQISGSQLDQTEGVITHTGNDLDVAIEGAGYFKVQTANGIAYTRNGHFEVDAKGTLTTDAGEPVLGQRGPITLGRGPVTISADGTISSSGAISGKLAVVTFAPGTQMSNRGGSEYSAPVNSEMPATGATVQQGALEGSNVSPVEGVVQLISAQRAAESMRHALSLLDSDMDKTAVQDLARVS
jgi:flagellar basal-body rod protein FlgF/flagellar basal-body rod protein FlgG